MSLLTDCKMYLDITDNDRDDKIKLLLKAGYSSMTDTADVAKITDFDVTSESVTIPELVTTTLSLYVGKEMETDPDKRAKYNALYEESVATLAMSSVFGDFTQLLNAGG